MRVRDLIKILKKLPQDLPVYAFCEEYGDYEVTKVEHTEIILGREFVMKQKEVVRVTEA